MTVLSKKFLWSPLGEFAEGFLAELAGLGYSPRSSEAHLFLMKHLSRWLAAQGLSAHDLTNELAVRFVAERREKESKLRSPPGPVALLRHLPRRGGVPVVPVGLPRRGRVG